MRRLRAIDGGGEHSELYADLQAIYDDHVLPDSDALRAAIEGRNLEHIRSHARDLKMAAEELLRLTADHPNG